MANRTQAPTPTPVLLILGPEPQIIRCPFCHFEVVTSIQRKPSMKTHLSALLLCVLGLWLCCFIPYCIDSCLEVQHSCPNCGYFLGTYSSPTC